MNTAPRTEVKEKLAITRNLLGMTLGGEDTLNCLGIIIVEEILEYGNDNQQEQILDDMIQAMYLNYNLSKAQQTGHETLNAAKKIIAWVLDETATVCINAKVKLLAIEIKNFTVQAKQARTPEQIKKTVDKMLKNCEVIIKEAEPFAKDIEAHTQSMLIEKEELKARATRYGSAVAVLSDNAAAVTKNEKISQKTRKFCKCMIVATAEKTPILLGNKIGIESVKNKEVFEAQIVDLEAMAIEVRKNIKQEE